MPVERVSMRPPTPELRKGGAVVGITDRIYEVSGPTIRFDDVLVRGDLSGELEYNGKTLRIVRVEVIAGLEVGVSGPRGPVWKGVECSVVN